METHKQDECSLIFSNSQSAVPSSTPSLAPSASPSLSMAPSAGIFCGNGVCDEGEHCVNCPSDCAGTDEGKEKYCCMGYVEDIDSMMESMDKDMMKRAAFCPTMDPRCACAVMTNGMQPTCQEKKEYCTEDEQCCSGECDLKKNECKKKKATKSPTKQKQGKKARRD